MKSCPLGATSPQGGCFIVRKILPAASVWRVAWRGLEWAPTGQAFGGRPGRTLIGSEKAPQAQEGTDGSHRKGGDGLAPRLSLRAHLKCRKGNGAAWRAGAGEQAGLRSYLDSRLSSELFRAGASKPSALRRVGARIGHTHKVGMHYSGGIAHRSSEPLRRRSLLPQKPIVENYKQTGWKSYSHLAAGEIQVITGNPALAAEKFRSERQHECH